MSGLTLFRSRPDQDQVFTQFAKDDGAEVRVYGLNRYGKTLLCAARIAAFVLDQPIILSDGLKLNMRPGRLSGKPVDVALIGYDWRFCGRNFYNILFEPGAFEQNTLKSPPLIPFADVADMRWENAKDQILRECVLKNGSRLRVIPSTIDGGFGAGALHAAWCDEGVANPNLLDEVRMRLADYRGTLAWSRTGRTPRVASFDLKSPWEPELEHLDDGR